METERLIPKQFTVKFLDKCEWQKGFKPDINTGLVCYAWGSKNSKGTGAGVYMWVPRRWQSFSIGLCTRVFRLRYMPLRLV